MFNYSIVVFNNFNNVKYILSNGLVKVNEKTIKKYLDKSRRKNTIFLKFDFEDKNIIPKKIYTIYYDNNYFKISEYGATVISCTIDDSSLLFLSKKAKLNGEQPIRGGIPIVFPTFGNSNINIPKHGFARNNIWNYVREWKNEEYSGIIFELTHNDIDDNIRANWNYEFSLQLNVSIGRKKLVTELAY